MIFNLGTKEVLGVIESDSTKLIGSYESVLKINEIDGACVQGENPSPTNPQEIRNVAISGIKTHGKNLFDASKLILGSISTDTGVEGDSTVIKRTDFIPCTSSSNYTISGIANGVRMFFYDSNKAFISTTVFEATNVIKSFVTPSNCAYIRMHGAIANWTDVVMLNEGTEALPYEPYTESSITFSEPISLYGLDDVRDILTSKQIKRKFVKRVYNGSENWTITTGGGYSNVMRLILDDYKQTDSNSINYMFSNFTAITADERYKEETAFISGRYMLCLSSMFTTVDEWKAHLASNPMTVIYELAEETTEELPAADQIALSQLKTFNGMTYVEFISDVQPTLKSEYATNREGSVTLKAYADVIIDSFKTDEATVKANEANSKADSTIGAFGEIVTSGTILENRIMNNDIRIKTMFVVTNTYTPSDYPFTDNKEAFIIYVADQGANRQKVFAISYQSGDIYERYIFNGNYLEEWINLSEAKSLKNRTNGGEFATEIVNGIIKLFKDDVLHGTVGANTVIHSSSGKSYNTVNVRAESDADFIALTNEDNSISYYMNINKIPITGNGYTEPHYFNGDMRINGNLKATGGIWSDETHITKMGINGGAAQFVEWVWDTALGRWVLCSTDTGIEVG